MKQATFMTRVWRMTIPMRLIRDAKGSMNNNMHDVTGPNRMMCGMPPFRLHGTRLHTIRAS